MSGRSYLGPEAKALAAHTSRRVATLGQWIEISAHHDGNGRGWLEFENPTTTESASFVFGPREVCKTAAEARAFALVALGLGCVEGASGSCLDGTEPAFAGHDRNH